MANANNKLKNKRYRLKYADKIAKQKQTYFQKNKAKVYAYQKKWKKENKEKMRKYQATYKAKYPEKYEVKNFNSKISGLKIKFTLVEYKEMEKKQKGLCAICKKKDPKRSLSIDHCHITNKVRGLLCKKCNSGLGFFEDDWGILFEAIKYLAPKMKSINFYG